jgi:hypothetical protein
MKRLIIVLVLIVLPATLNASNIPLASTEFRSVIAVPCGGDLPTDLCTSVGNAIAQTKALLGNYSEQGWQLVSTTPMLYGPGNEGVIFLLRRNLAIKTLVRPPQQFEIVMGMSCGQGPNGLPYRLCTGNGASLEELLNGYSAQGWQVVNTTSCTYRYDQGDVGMVVYLLSK